MKRSYLLLHAAILLLGFSGVFGKLIDLNEVVLTWYRVAFSALILLVIVCCSPVRFTVLSRKEQWLMARSGLLITCSWVLFYASIRYANVSVAVVCYCLSGFFTAVLGPLLNRQRIRRTEVLLSSLTLAGIGLIFHFDTSYRTGIILGIVSPLFASLYTIYSERLVQRYDSRLLNLYQMAGGAIGLGMLLPVYFYCFPDTVWLPGWRDTGNLLLLAAFCTVFVYLVFTKLLKKLSAFTVNLALNLEPVYAIGIAFWMLGESKAVSPAFWAGIALILVSVAVQMVLAARVNKL